MIHQWRAVVDLVVVDKAGFDFLKIAVQAGFAFVLERGWAEACFCPAHMTVICHAGAGHGGDDFIAVRFLPGDGAVGEFIVKLSGQSGV